MQATCIHCKCKLELFMLNDWVDVEATILGWMCTENPDSTHHEPEGDRL